MFAVLSTRRKALARVALVAAALALAACEPMPSGRAPAIDAGAPVPVALILPGGTGNSTDEMLARNLKQAADLAIADLQGVKIDLRVYNAGSDAATSAAMARKAVDEGAKVILGPVFAEAANAAGVAVAPAGVKVISQCCVEPLSSVTSIFCSFGTTLCFSPAACAILIFPNVQSAMPR